MSLIVGRMSRDSGWSPAMRPVRSAESTPIDADQVLVHRVVVVHVELHHRDDLAEIGDEAAEHAGLVHVPEHGSACSASQRISRNSRFASGVVLQRAVDALQRFGDEPQRIGMEGEVVAGRPRGRCGSG